MDEREMELVKVTGAEFSDGTFEDPPFDRLPGWLEQSLVDGSIVQDNLHDTDYAVWRGRTARYLEPIWAGPGDYIVRHDDRLYIMKCLTDLAPRPTGKD